MKAAAVLTGAARAILASLAVVLAGCTSLVGISPRSPSSASGVLISVVVAEGASGALRVGALRRKYRGRLEKVVLSGKPLLVNHLALDDYIRGVLPGEIPPGWAPEALKAMAVVTRTYAWHKWSKRAGKSYHLMSDTRDQMYCGLSCEDKRSDRAVTATRGKVLMHGGKPVPAFTHSCCAGSTEAVQEVWGGGPVSFLSSVKCEWCVGSKHYGPWTLILDRITLARRVASKTGGAKNVWRIRTEGKTKSGRVKTVAVSVGKRVVRMSGASFRSLVGYNDLRSTRFEVTERGDSVEFRGTGWGHGVGICQEGAGALAGKGWGYEEILRHYFPGARIVNLRR